MCECALTGGDIEIISYTATIHIQWYARSPSLYSICLGTASSLPHTPSSLVLFLLILCSSSGGGHHLYEHTHFISQNTTDDDFFFSSSPLCLPASFSVLLLPFRCRIWYSNLSACRINMTYLESEVVREIDCENGDENDVDDGDDLQVYRKTFESENKTRKKVRRKRS